MVASSLRSFIKDVRSAKTLADERAIITKQSAKIRTKLRDDHLSHSKKRINISKLLYLYILGEKTHFGQVECINLIASDDFSDKRLGYLSTMLLLDESQSLLTLLTNMLNNDLHHPNKYIVSLALTTLGSLSSNELARDLYPDVENILKNSNDSFLIKKALQCIAKLIMKDHTILEIFPVQILNEKLLSNDFILTHAVYLGICKVLQSMLINFEIFSKENDTTIILNSLSKIIPHLFQRLSTLNSKNLEPSYDVQGIQDPFLQVELITTIKWIFKIGNELNLSQITQFNDKFTDLLTQIATNTDSKKNAGHAILYEIAKTTFELKLDQPLRVLGINILANFLKVSADTKRSNSNNNIKYVALNTLIKAVPEELDVVQRHRKFILHCLYDHDISIKFRALELTFAIVNENNLLELSTELINFLRKISKSNYIYNSNYIDIDDFKTLIVFTIDNLISKFEIFDNNNKNLEVAKFKFDSLVEILKLVGNFINLDKINEFLITINNFQNMEYKIESLSKLLLLSFTENENDNLNLSDNVGLQLVNIWCIGEYANLIISSKKTNNKVVNEKSLTDYLIKLNDYHSLSNNNRIIQYILTSSLKMSTKISDSQCIEKLRQLILGHDKNPNLIIQAKSVQCGLLFDQPANVKNLILQAMPKFERKVVTPSIKDTFQSETTTKPSNRNNDLLLDLLSDIDDSKPAATTTKTGNISDSLFLDLHAETKEKTTVDESLIVPQEAVTVHDTSNIAVYTNAVKVSEGAAEIDMYFKAKSNSLTNLQTQCAVTKTQKLTLTQLRPGNDIKSNEVSMQTLKISGSGKLKLRVKVTFTINNEMINEQFDYKFSQSI
ncbi:hypothetical protein KAFR_0K02100 [Kazachstania africana CBS 2517]|uniref:AP-1 complex subunit gamma n=1 Tax=Kazachstania africana (strain ATCC 22294 / BCRC 22015 / CBS 2517 / CECT 1963 / NBRC 1671 / NRRL Y-8276) TaxID=1071382 RepID=H2B1R4_KAZAF|nr:hypothetical protein KAFR_0K02100 [Kazachstania africana CBS 2517]CCF60564.1 hypothetical protein KAFR_0K02100 [Kazachstania africana CBS 2517]